LKALSSLFEPGAGKIGLETTTGGSSIFYFSSLGSSIIATGICDLVSFNIISELIIFFSLQA
jgi:hypothetical protein